MNRRLKTGTWTDVSEKEQEHEQNIKNGNFYRILGTVTQTNDKEQEYEQMIKNMNIRLSTGTWTEDEQNIKNRYITRWLSTET